MLTAEQKRLLEKLQATTNMEANLDASLKECRNVLEATEKALLAVRAERKAIDNINNEKTICFPWLADAIAQYHEMCDLKVAELLEKKLHPALKTAKRIRELAAEKREFHRKFRLTRSRVLYCERLFPHLKEYVAEGIDDLVREVPDQAPSDTASEDPVSKYMPRVEYERLSETDRNQTALDRWKRRRRERWEVGRDYERFVGYQLEKCGFTIEYRGITDGLADLGRDLVAIKGKSTQIIQCKCWIV